MFMDSMKWRKEARVDEIYKNFHKVYAKELEAYLKYWPGIYTYTMDGFPCFMERSGLIDPYSILKNTTADFRSQLNIWKIEDMEKMRRRREKATGLSAGAVFVVDMTGLSWALLSPAAMESFKEGSAVSKNNYPESLRKTYIINAPGFFTVTWNLLSSWMDPPTIEKTCILGSHYKEALLECMNNEDLPQSFGGTAPALKTGGIYQPFGINPNALIQEIGAGRLFEKTIEIPQAGKLEWEFKSQQFDIGFAIFRVENGVKKELIKWARLFSNSGALDVEPGKYLILWDNKYSWTKKKTIHYHFVAPV